MKKILVLTIVMMAVVMVGGCFSSPIGSEISADYEIKEEGKHKTIVLFHFSGCMSFEKAVAEMRKQGCRPATSEELDALVKSQPGLLVGYILIALKPIVWYDGHCLVTMVNGRSWHGAEPSSLNLDFLGDDWGGRYRFLAIRK